VETARPHLAFALYVERDTPTWNRNPCPQVKSRVSLLAGEVVDSPMMQPRYSPKQLLQFRSESLLERWTDKPCFVHSKRHVHDDVNISYFVNAIQPILVPERRFVGVMPQQHRGL
jgi:hypothetical protein